jgi:hypothetical protein
MANLHVGTETQMYLLQAKEPRQRNVVENRACIDYGEGFGAETNRICTRWFVISEWASLALGVKKKTKNRYSVLSIYIYIYI